MTLNRKSRRICLWDVLAWIVITAAVLTYLFKKDAHAVQLAPEAHVTFGQCSEMLAVAQRGVSLEHQVVILGVGGSNPLGQPIK